MLGLLFGGTISAERLYAFLMGTIVAAIYGLMTMLLLRDREMPVPRLRTLELVAIVLIVAMDVRDTITSAVHGKPRGAEGRDRPAQCGDAHLDVPSGLLRAS